MCGQSVVFRLQEVLRLSDRGMEPSRPQRPLSKAALKNVAIRTSALGLVVLPASAEDTQAFQKGRLLRFMLLCAHPQTLDYYLEIAIKCIREAAGSTNLDIYSFFQMQIGQPSVVRKRFVLFVALNQSDGFFNWVNTHSAGDPVDTTAYCEFLGSEFRRLIEKRDARNLPSSREEDVFYPSLDHFVDALVVHFFQW